MKREIIAPLAAFATEAREEVRLTPGTLIAGWSILSPLAGAQDSYLVRFEADHLEYTCALPRFLPRTRSVHPVGQDAQTGSAIAV